MIRPRRSTALAGKVRPIEVGAIVEFSFPAAPHVESRWNINNMPGLDEIKRYPVPDSFIDWATPYMGYDPPDFRNTRFMLETSPRAVQWVKYDTRPAGVELVHKGLAEALLRKDAATAEQVQFTNEEWAALGEVGFRSLEQYVRTGEAAFFKAVPLILASGCGPLRYDRGGKDKSSMTNKSYGTVKGAPLNPAGRTGLCGVGQSYWGPNCCVDVFMSFHDAKAGSLEVLTILRPHNRQWSLPGCRIDREEDETHVEALRKYLESSLVFKTDEQKRSFWQDYSRQGPTAPEKGVLVYNGYVDHQFNTDNSWRETSAWLIECSEKYEIVPNPDPKKLIENVRWVEVRAAENKHIAAIHRPFVDAIAQRLLVPSEFRLGLSDEELAMRMRSALPRLFVSPVDIEASLQFNFSGVRNALDLQLMGERFRLSHCTRGRTQCPKVQSACRCSVHH